MSISGRKSLHIKRLRTASNHWARALNDDLQTHLRTRQRPLSPPSTRPKADGPANQKGIMSQDCTTERCFENAELCRFFALLTQQDVQVFHTQGNKLPTNAFMHDRRASVPALVVSPRNEEEVAQTLKAFKRLQLFGKVPLSVKSGGHGYFNGASCTGVMLNLSGLTSRRIEKDTLYLEPGCLLAGTMDILTKNRKAVPHGDCFGVGAGGHFLTAGWDLLLTRRYGLGCQSVVGGRMALWDGTVLEVDENNHSELLHAMRGGAAAGAGVVTEIRLRLIDEPARATWRVTKIDKQQLRMVLSHNILEKSINLPREVSVSFHLHFDQTGPVCCLNIFSLLTTEETINTIEAYLGPEVWCLVGEKSEWHEKSLLDLRLMPASDGLKKSPTNLAAISQEDLHSRPADYWTQAVINREMNRSYLSALSYWIKPNCEKMIQKLYDAFEQVRDHPARERMFAIIILGGGRMNELQEQCSMILGKALARFETHWDDDAKDREWNEGFTNEIGKILRSEEDSGPGRPYRGDIWMEGQDRDAELDSIFKKYDRRFS